MPKTDVLKKLSDICLALPETKVTMTWGNPHFRVGDKIFAGFGEEEGKPVIGFKLEKEHARAVVEDPRFWPAPYVGRHGWVSMDASRIRSWKQLRGMIYESYRLIAPKRLVRQLDEGNAPRRKKT